MTPRASTFAGGVLAVAVSVVGCHGGTSIERVRVVSAALPPSGECIVQATSDAPPASAFSHAQPMTLTLALGDEVVIDDLRIWTIREHIAPHQTPTGYTEPARWERYLRASTSPLRSGDSRSDTYENARLGSVTETELRVGRYRIRGLGGGGDGPITVAVERLDCARRATLSLPSPGEHMAAWLGTDAVTELELLAQGKPAATIYVTPTDISVFAGTSSRRGRLRPDGASWDVASGRAIDPPAPEARVADIAVRVEEEVRDQARRERVAVLVRIERLREPEPADPPPPRRSVTEVE